MVSCSISLFLFDMYKQASLTHHSRQSVIEKSNASTLMMLHYNYCPYLYLVLVKRKISINERKGVIRLISLTVFCSPEAKVKWHSTLLVHYILKGESMTGKRGIMETYLEHCWERRQYIYGITNHRFKAFKDLSTEATLEGLISYPPTRELFLLTHINLREH